jgi:hypothetical protein
MTPEEYIQLKAFARQDGALLSLLWIGSFACYIQGLSSPALAFAALLLVTLSPFFAASRLRHFRDYAREGFITFKRGYAYTVMSFFYAGLLMAAAVYVYFEFMDNGYLLGVYSSVMDSEEGKRVLEMSGMKEEMKQGLQDLYNMRPIDFSVNILTAIIFTGFVLGLPIAALLQRKVTSNDSLNEIAKR